VPDPLKLLSVPSTALTSFNEKSVGGLLNVNVTSALGWAMLRTALSMDTLTVGTTVSTVKGAVLPLL
jgi:hypothetical protein